MLSIETLKRVAARHGYQMDDESCLDLLEGSYEGETVSEALLDYLGAYEGLSEDKYLSIYYDAEGKLCA